ncbi:MAG TPA: alpha/beta fold hydrolase [Stellaceae bacterium]|nr:alpha/beta fold hydrolase [Stellaceae bacterium]
MVVWSHGRSISYEDYKSPNPPYLEALRQAGWDVLRFDRLRDQDTLGESSRRLAFDADRLKKEGYRRVVLAGQSFGAFLSLMAADRSNGVDAVVATAPAAFGSFDEFYDSWRLNATRLYPILEKVKRARVMLFYFHDDDFDPGGRGARSRTILQQRGLPFAVIDQPQFLTGHWASGTGLFMRRFAGCIGNFIADDALKGEFSCEPIWGNEPSADLNLPSELVHPHHPVKAALAGSSPRVTSAVEPAPVREAWYGLYPNGREVLLAVETVDGNHLTAVYAIGPGIQKGEPAEWSRRKGSLRHGEFVFAEPGKSTLRFRPRDDGGLEATWTSSDGKFSMEAGMRRIDPNDFLRRGMSGSSRQPQ